MNTFPGKPLFEFYPQILITQFLGGMEIFSFPDQNYSMKFILFIEQLLSIFHYIPHFYFKILAFILLTTS